MTTKREPLLSERMRSLSNQMGNAEAYAIMQGFASDAEAIEAALSPYTTKSIEP